MKKTTLDIITEDIDIKYLDIIADFTNTILSGNNNKIDLSFDIDSKGYYEISYNDENIQNGLGLSGFGKYIINVLETYLLEDIDEILMEYERYNKLLSSGYELSFNGKLFLDKLSYKIFEFEKETDESVIYKMYEEGNEIYEIKHSHFQTDIIYNKEYLHIWEYFKKDNDNILNKFIIQELPTSGNEEFVEDFVEQFQKGKSFKIQDSVAYEGSGDTIHSRGRKLGPYDVIVKIK